jgi:hypothetical protein
VSVLTKVFVVLLTVFSIALSMLVVAAFAEQQNWKSSAGQWQAAAAAAQAKEQVATQNASLDLQRALARHGEDVRTINALKDARVAAEAKIGDLERLKAESESRLTVEQGAVTSLADHNKLLQAAINREKELTEKLATRKSELEQENVDLTDRVKELTVNMAMAASQIRALRQQIASMEGTPGAEAVTQVPGGPGIVEADTPTAAAPAMPSVTAPIRGEIKDVKGNLASITVGNADGVAPGMNFLIYRPGQDGKPPLYLGMLRINKVDANESAGQIDQTSGDVRAGDMVRDELSFVRRG